MLDDDTTVNAPESTATTTDDTATASTGAAAEAPPAEAAGDPVTGEQPDEAPVKKAAAKKAAKKTATKKAATKKSTTKRTAAKKAAGTHDAPAGEAPDGDQPALDVPGSTVAAQVAATEAPVATTEAPVGTGEEEGAQPPRRAAKKAAAKKTTAKKATGKRTAAKKASGQDESGQNESGEPAIEAGSEADPGAAASGADEPGEAPPTMLLFQAPEPVKAPAKRARKKPAKPAEAAESEGAEAAEQAPGQAPGQVADATDVAVPAGQVDDQAEEDADSEDGEGGSRRRRRRGGRRRRKGGSAEGGEAGESGAAAAVEEQGDAGAEKAQDDTDAGEAGTTRRRRRRRRAGEEGDDNGDDASTVTRVRKARSAEDEIAGFSGSTRLEAKKQRRREGREAGRRRAPIISEAEFLARRESVDRVMVIRQRAELTQIAVLEDKVLVEHYVARESQTSLIGNVYLGRVQNVLPSMEAAFIDIGKGRNAVLYAGEVNWDALGAKDGSQRKIESVLKPGQTVLVQVTKDPVAHKGARLTSQISLPGRFLVYVPDGTTSGISRKLPDTERNRLKTLLKEIVPESAGVIVRTAAEGASEQELTRDVERLKARWEDIEKKVEKGNAPQLLYGEPDLTLKVVRDLFTEDFAKLVVSGEDAWQTVKDYVEHVAPDLADRLEKHEDTDGRDAFSAYRIDDQIAKGLDRKVWLPSGGSLVIDRTEAMTVIDVNTGKFTGSGGNLEETVTKNNLEAAEEIVRQLRLRDIGGIIVVDFIDMVLESNRDLVLRRLVECLGRDRTRHQVAEITSLGLVQMTRKRIGTGLLEAFSETCEHCQGRGLLVHHEPVEPKRKVEEEPRRSRRGRGGRAKGGADDAAPAPTRPPTPADIAAMARHEDHTTDEGKPTDDGAEAPGIEAPSTAPASAEGPDTAVAVPALPEEEIPVTSVDTSGPGDGSGRSDAQGAEQDVPEGAASSDAGDVPEETATEPGTTAAQADGVTAGAADRPTPVREPDVDGTAADGEPAPEPVTAAPRITTSVRRVSARRPAGPPQAEANGAGTDTEPASDGPASPEHDAAEPVAPAHVPVKRKGSRKR